MNKPINLASLPKDQALVLARAGGRAILGDIDAVTAVYPELFKSWVDRNIPKAVGQSDDEFGELLEQIENEFNGGVDEAVASAVSAGRLEAVTDKRAINLAVLAWNIHNVLRFVAAGLDDDKPDALPVRCTIYQLQEMANELATLVQDAEWSCRLET